MTKEHKDYHGKYFLTLVFALAFLFSFGMVSHNAFADTVIATIPVESYPSGIGVNPNTNMVYVANQLNNTVSVIDGSTNSVVNTIPVGSSPTGVAVNPVTNLIYVLDDNNCCSHPQMDVINGSTNAVQTIPIAVQEGGIRTGSVAVNPITNMVYGVYHSSEHFGNAGDSGGYVAIIDGKTNTFVNSTFVNGFPQGIAVNQNTDMIYATGSYGYPPGPYSQISVIDGSTNNVIENINVPNYPSAVAVNPNTNMVYATESNGGKLAVIDGSTDVITTEIPVGPGPDGVSVNPNTDKIYVANGASNTVYVIDGASNQVLTTLTVGSSPASVVTNPSIDQIYVTNYASNTVSAIQGDSSNTLTVPSAPTELTTTAISSSQINLSWTAPTSNGGSTITGYMIERSTDSGTTWSTISSNTGSVSTTYSDTGLTHSTTYTYRVSAINSVGTSASSNTSSATTFNAVPLPPTGLVATGKLLQISLSWNAPTDNGGTSIIGYEIQRSSNGGSTWSTLVANTASTGTTYTDSQVQPLTTYTYRVSAINDVGMSGPSNTASASTPSVGPVTPPSLP